MSSPKDYDRDYFEDGLKTGKSLYENFRWLPSVSLPLASIIKNLFPNDVILDYGCAKGFVVYALRLLGVEAYGFDISNYALEHCKSGIREGLYAQRCLVPVYDTFFCKDTLEHCNYETLDVDLRWLKSTCKRGLLVIPLADSGRYRIPEYEFDRTHVIREDEEWWAIRLNKAGFEVKMFTHQMKGIKEQWWSHNPTGNGVFLLDTKSSS